MDLSVRGITDTSHPVDLVPIYFMHTIDAPFCPLPGCWCHTDQEQIAPLLQHIADGEMTLQEAANFAEGKTV